MTIELDTYGFMLETRYAYISLTWEILVVTTLVAIIFKAYKNYSKKSGK
jgi:hypothetical protein